MLGVFATGFFSDELLRIELFESIELPRDFDLLLGLDPNVSLLDLRTKLPIFDLSDCRIDSEKPFPGPPGCCCGGGGNFCMGSPAECADFGEGMIGD